jgi:hypothetical protein
LPVWSADADPRVLSARAIPWTDVGDSHWPITLGNFFMRAVVGAGREHIRIDDRGRSVRLDVVEGSLLAGPASLSVEMAVGSRLPAQLTAVGEFRGLLAGRQRTTKLSARHHHCLLALAAYDARLDGASLRAIADRLFTPGDWPGDGEHRKSRIRRFIAQGEALVRAGPRAILR